MRAKNLIIESDSAMLAVCLVTPFSQISNIQHFDRQLYNSIRWPIINIRVVFSRISATFIIARNFWRALQKCKRDCTHSPQARGAESIPIIQNKQERTLMRKYSTKQWRQLFASRFVSYHALFSKRLILGSTAKYLKT